MTLETMRFARVVAPAFSVPILRIVAKGDPVCAGQGGAYCSCCGTGRDAELEKIDFAIRLNYCLVADGPHPAVDSGAVWRRIDALLDRRTIVQFSNSVTSYNLIA